MYAKKLASHLSGEPRAGKLPKWTQSNFAPYSRMENCQIDDQSTCSLSSSSKHSVFASRTAKNATESIEIQPSLSHDNKKWGCSKNTCIFPATHDLVTRCMYYNLVYVWYSVKIKINWAINSYGGSVKLINENDNSRLRPLRSRQLTPSWRCCVFFFARCVSRSLPRILAQTHISRHASRVLVGE